MDELILERNYQERLEERIIKYIADIKNITLQEAMDLYYHNPLADKIAAGVYGMQYLDYKLLAQFVLEADSTRAGS